MTVYIVTSGEYSNYQINAVFLQKEKAEEYVAIRAGKDSYSDDFYIEEYETRDGSDLMDGCQFARVYWDEENNIIKAIKYIEPDSLQGAHEEERRDKYWPHIFTFYLRTDSPGIKAIQDGERDYSTLLKIAQDRFALFKAVLEGVV